MGKAGGDVGTGGGEHGAGKWSSLAGLYPGEKMTSGKDAWYMVSSACREPTRTHSLA